ncbi:Cytokinin dehydrogenase 5 [Trifolium repens]|nr:Cytokinin dehydrogenase 5 [Trifolium repens]
MATMKNNLVVVIIILLSLAICCLVLTVGLTVDPTLTEILHVGLEGEVSVEASELEAVSFDFGRLSNRGETTTLAVVRPASLDDVVKVVKAANKWPLFAVSARGHGHSINGQADTRMKGVVIEMGKVRGGEIKGGPKIWEKEMYVDVWGGELWIDLLKATLEYGLAPMSWTDYLYLSVGGTLSNAGISGQTFNYGPQISNVFELDVVTGKGEVMTCSEERNSDLFHAVLGGLGQFGIITRARIALQPAPQRVRWIRVLYSNFSTFTKDQEFLISLHGKPTSQRFDYVEGFVIVDEGLINNWRSSFFSPSNPVKISSLNADGGVLYCLEITKNYHQGNADSVDEEIQSLLKKLDFIPTSVFTTDVPYVDFLNRVHKAELKLRSKGLWDVSHPWLNLFVPKSRIEDFDKGVFKGILGNKTSGPILIYPMNKNK